jgi:hypothetical protein
MTGVRGKPGRRGWIDIPDEGEVGLIVEHVVGEQSFQVSRCVRVRHATNESALLCPEESGDDRTPPVPGSGSGSFALIGTTGWSVALWRGHQDSNAGHAGGDPAAEAIRFE